jgi:hypothetical protein
MIWWLIVLVAYILIAVLFYFKVTKKWNNISKFEQIWFSACWIVVIILKVIEKIIHLG